MADDDLTIRLRAIGARPFKRDVDRGARALDNFGDQAGQAARKLARLNRQTGNARLNLGPLSVKAKHAGLAVGAIAVLTGKASTALLGLAEASATAVGGAGAAGGVGLTALAQGLGTVKLATAGLTEALGGNEEALAKLNPAQAKFVEQLQEMQPMLDTLRESASGGLLGGAGKGITAASRNFSVLNKIVRSTSGTLGGLAARAGRGLGSARAGADLAAIGATNVRIIQSLGNATLDLASAVGHVLVEARPLAEWLANAAERGARLTDVWIANKRATGELSAFFARAKTNLTQLGAIAGNISGGVLNLFGARDVDGTKTLANLERITARFEQWSRSPAVRGGIGQAIIDQIPKAAGGVASALAKLMGAAAPQAAKIFLDAFLAADVWGKALIGGLLAKRLGLGKGLGKVLGIGGVAGGKGSVLGKLATRGASPANPLWVQMVGAVPGVPGTPTTASKGSKVGRALKGAGKVVLPIGAGVAAAEGLAAIRKSGNYHGQPTRTSRIPGLAHGFEGAPKPKARSLPTGFGFDPIFHNVLMLDGRVVYEASERHSKKEKARK